jgi:asparagine synthase (glutamine-hydrolysing)
LDSSSLVALIRRHSAAPLKTFSIEFEEPSLDESSFQRTLIEHLGVEHRSIRCRNRDIAEDFPATVFHAETPILRTAPTPMRRLSGLVRSAGYKVVLTGEGADEALGGYDLFKEAKIRQFWARNPKSAWRSLLLKALYPYLETSGAQAQSYLRSYYGIGLDKPAQRGFSHLTRWFTTAQCKLFFSSDLAAAVSDDAAGRLLEQLPVSFDRWHPFNRAQYLEAKTLLSGYLLSSQGDRMLMANSVEGRFPFLDHRVIEFADRLPPRVKMRALNEKFLLKRAMAPHLPREIVARHKQPYRAPDIPAFFSGEPPAYVEDLLSQEKLARYSYFDAKKVGFLVAKARRGSSIAYKDNMALVGILSTQLCHYHFIERFSDFAPRMKQSSH